MSTLRTSSVNSSNYSFETSSPFSSTLELGIVVSPSGSYLKEQAFLVFVTVTRNRKIRNWFLCAQIVPPCVWLSVDSCAHSVHGGVCAVLLKNLLYIIPRSFKTCALGGDVHEFVLLFFALLCVEFVILKGDIVLWLQIKQNLKASHNSA
jgi:hypothetical protein